MMDHLTSQDSHDEVVLNARKPEVVGKFVGQVDVLG